MAEETPQPVDVNGDLIPTPLPPEAPASLDITAQPEPHRGFLERIKALLEKDEAAVKAWIEEQEAKL